VLQQAEILHRVGEAVGVIDAQPVDLPLGQEAQGNAVRLLEDLRILHADGGERIDVEKSPVIDLFARDPPVRQPIGLGVKWPEERGLMGKR